MTSQAEPADERRTYAVVGSTGKATTCYLLDHLLAALGRSTAIHSTVETKIGAQRTPVERDVVPDLDALLAAADALRIDDTLLELRWADLDRGVSRTLDVAAFTHLDPAVEGDQAQQRLGQAAALLRSAARAIVLVDDDAGAALAAQVPGAITVGTGARGRDAEWLVSINATRDDHADFSLTHRTGRSVSSSIWIPARFSVGYAAIALVALLDGGVAGTTLSRLLPAGLRPVVPGRVERVHDRPRCIVDIAHNPARLARVLAPLRATTKGRLTVVVGARGSDPAEVRRAIGAAAAAADTVIVTDDDHGLDDDPAAIRADVLAAARGAGTAEVAEVAPRRAAIRSSVALASRNDTVLIAGRGHLTMLDVAGEREHLDDREEVRAGIAQREAQRADAG